jgi:hypothetical protein
VAAEGAVGRREDVALGVALDDDVGRADGLAGSTLDPRVEVGQLIRVVAAVVDGADLPLGALAIDGAWDTVLQLGVEASG